MEAENKYMDDLLEAAAKDVEKSVRDLRDAAKGLLGAFSGK